MSSPASVRRPARRDSSRRESGQALVEFALIAPLLLLLVLGVVEFGRAWNAYQVLTDAAREGARTGVVANLVVTEDSVRGLVSGSLDRAGLDPASATITLQGWRTGRGTPLELTVQYPYDLVWLRPFLGWTTTEGQVTLTATSVMRNE